jgi:hypothetical protein
VISEELGGILCRLAWSSQANLAGGSRWDTAQGITQSQSRDRQQGHDLPGGSWSCEFAGYDRPYGFFGCQTFRYPLQGGCHWRTYLCRDLPGSSQFRQTAVATWAGSRFPGGHDVTTEMLDRAYGQELTAAGLLLQSGPVDRDLLKKWVRTGFERRQGNWLDYRPPSPFGSPIPLPPIAANPGP